MKIEVRYQTITGNTEIVAKTIGSAIDAPVKSVEYPLEGDIDLMFLGGGIYASGLNGRLKHFIQGIPMGRVCTIALYSTSMNLGTIYERVRNLLQGKNINLIENELCIADIAIKTELDDKTQKEISRYVDEVIKIYHENNG